ncbi:hypothetical protein GCM10009836_34550 [Pseudonocardia ailaonensis]|uniref:SnoaL-like domain-containing protein n=1 Tax=Pseudonocardia ailaonensis TaxID=367279 RepID=A0ABN2N410_9PSEU
MSTTDLSLRALLAYQTPNRYAQTLHDRDPEKVAELFTPDAYLHQVWGPVTGRADIARNYRDRFADWTDATHWVANSVLTSVSEEEAKVRAFVVGLFFFVPDSSNGTTLYRGEYDFTLSWVESDWQISTLFVSRHGLNGIDLQESGYAPPPTDGR